MPKKNPPSHFLKHNYNGSTDIISFGHKDALRENKKRLKIEVNYIKKSEIINHIWNDNIGTYNKKDIEYIVNSFINMIASELKRGMKIKIDGLGTFIPFIKQAYVGKDVNTGNVSIIPSGKYIKFKPSKKLKAD